MTLDLKITGGTIVDGTGAAAIRGDVGIRDGRVVAVGTVDEGATRTIDATDLVVAPGFVDLHTHYDAQLLWDATASPSPMHGVTTLFGGNCGFTLAPTPDDGDGHPVPSRAASRDEMVRLAGTLQSHPGTQLELIIAGCLNGFTDDEVDLMTSMSLAADRPVNWNVLGVTPGGMHEKQLDAGTRAAARGARIVALTLPQGMRIRLSFLTGFVFDGFPGWRETIGLPVPERIRALSDPEVRARLDAQAHSKEAGVLAGLARWERLEVIEAFTPETKTFEGRHVGDIAQEQGKAPFD